MSVDLSTMYMGLELKNPLVIAACSLSEKVESLQRLEEAGAAAVVLHSLFEEQVEHDQEEIIRLHEFGTESFAEALTYFPEPTEYRSGAEDYLEHVGRVKSKLSIPIIASLNGGSSGGWVRYAGLMQDAGADALELNIYHIAADINVSSAEVEQQYIDLVAKVKQSISIPLAVKIGPHFSSPGNVAKQLAEAGADALVLFNRFIQPDIDPDDLQVSTHLELSTSPELLLPLRWIAILRGRVSASLALTTGIHSARDLAKALLAGADVGMVASAIYRQGFGQITTILDGLRDWMAEKEFQSVEQLKGSMSHVNCSEPTAFERGNYMKTLVSFTGRPI